MRICQLTGKRGPRSVPARPFSSCPPAGPCPGHRAVGEGPLSGCGPPGLGLSLCRSWSWNPTQPLSFLWHISYFDLVSKCLNHSLKANQERIGFSHPEPFSLNINVPPDQNSRVRNWDNEIFAYGSGCIPKAGGTESGAGQCFILA